MDDLITGANDIEQAFELYENSKCMMKKAGLNLRKWNSNSAPLLEKICKRESGMSSDVSVKNSITKEEESFVKSTSMSFNFASKENCSKLLGITWNNHSDEFSFDFSDLIEYTRTLPVTKRSVLKIAAKIFDPLGFLSPFVVRLKILFRDLCVDRIDWDELLQGEVLKKWNAISAEFSSISCLKVPRCYYSFNSTPLKFQLHGFSDASSLAYGAVLYLKTVYADGSVTVRIVAAKTRVSPVKSQTIPRLELVAAVVLSRLVVTVRNSLEIVDSIETFLWTDSTVVLFWINNHKPWKQYVSSRVTEILEHTSRDMWHHCPGHLNPADMPSRGLSGNELCNSESWWNGPQFLQLSEDDWPIMTLFDSCEEAQLEIMKTPVSHSFVTSVTMASNLGYPTLDEVIDCKRFSNLNKLLRVTVYVLRFVNRLKKHSTDSNSSSTDHSSLFVPSADEINVAELYWMKSIQFNRFQAELIFLSSNHGSRPARVDQFGLYIDESKVLRCKGRINNSSLALNSKRPILLPPDHPYVKLLITDVHQRVKHSGTNDTLTALRERFWILKGRQVVGKIVRWCTFCQKMDGSAYPTVSPPDLPSDRVSEDPPFSHVGLDFAGPLYVHADKNSSENHKTYICLFTCAATRAIHLELVNDLNVSSYLLAFRRFCGRCGLPSTLLSDNAKTFKAASREVRGILRSREVLVYLSNNRITWNFIVERAPWWGGFWERMVQSAKKCLRKSVGRSTLSFDQLNTLLVEIEAIINSRPLTYVYSDSEGVSYALSPSHFLHGRRLTTTPNSEH